MKTARPTKHSPATAFMMVELLVGVGIMAITIISVYAGITYSIATTDVIRKNQRATQIILQTFELVRLYDWEQMTNNDFMPDTIFANDTNIWSERTGSRQGATYWGTVANTAPTTLGVSYANDLRQITVTLNWNAGGVQRGRTNYTLVARQGLQNYVY